MKTRRLTGLAAAATAGLLILSACAGPDVEDSTTPAASPDPDVEQPPANGTDPAGVAPGTPLEGGSVTVGWNQPMNSQNNVTFSGNAAANSNILYMTNWRFFQYNPHTMEVEMNTEFGSIDVVSEEPFVVELSVNEGVVWSDGVQVTAADLLLEWFAGSGLFEHDDEDREGRTFNWSSTIWGLITEFPEISEDGLSVTLTFDAFSSDWMMAMNPVPVAAHTIGRLALGIDDPAQATEGVIEAFRNNDRDAIEAIAVVYNEGFNFSSLPSDPGLFLSTGPFIMTEFVENQHIVLERNPLFTWGPIPHMDQVIVSFNEDPMSQLNAMQNFEIDLMAPQATVDVLAAAQSMEGVEHFPHQGATWEHLDVVFDNGGPFDPATYGGDEEVARLVRQAFLSTVPRQQIVDTLIRPLNPDAQVRNSLTIVPGAPGYDALVAGNNSAFFGAGDNYEQALALLAEAGVETPVDVRLLFGCSNVRRANQFQFIQAAGARGGFNVIDACSDDWGQLLSDSGQYDASLFGWQATNTMLLNSRSNHITGGPNNFGGFTNERVDELWTQIAESHDDAANLEAVIEIENILWTEGFSVSIFQFPEVAIVNANLQGVTTMPLSPSIFSHFWDWQWVAG